MVVALLLATLQPAWAQEAPVWLAAQPMPTARAATAAAVVDGQIYVVGGRDGRNRPLGVLERFDPQSGEWVALQEMPTPRFDAAAVSYRGLVLVIGGRGVVGAGPGENGQRRQVLDVVESYDPVSDQWIELPPLREAREGHAVVVLNDTLFVVGGSNRGQQILRSIEFLEPEEGAEWQTSSSIQLDVPRAAFAMAVSDDVAYAFGGFTPVPVNFVQQFRGSRAQTVLPPGAFRARGAHSAVAVGDTIYVLGGRGPHIGGGPKQESIMADVDLFVPSTQQWSNGMPLRTARESFAAVAVGSRLFAIGGRGENGEVLDAVEMMEVSVATASESPALPRDFYLLQNAPNPFRDRTTIRFSISDGQSAPVLLEVYDLQGRVVRTLVKGMVPAGIHEATWDGRGVGGDLASGVYICRLVQGSHQDYRKLVLIR